MGDFWLKKIGLSLYSIGKWLIEVEEVHREARSK